MEIVFLGHSSFKIKGKNFSIVTDPFDSSIVGLKYSKVEADVVTISHQHPDHNQFEQVGTYKKVIDGPGEYELSGVSIIGISSYHDKQKGADRGKNTIYVIEIDGFRIAHLGDLGHILSEDQVEDIGNIDVLMIPVGGVYTIDSTEAAEVAKSIQPYIILPMHYQMDGLLESFRDLQLPSQFVTQIGLSSESLPKLILREGQPIETEQKVVILEKK